MASDEDARSSGQASTAFAWSFANTVLARLGTLAIGIALARLLGPQEFGTYAVAFIALLAVLSFNELGVGLAIVRWTDDPRTIAPTVTTISLVTSALLTGAVLLAAGPFATAMGDPDAANLVRALSLCVMVNAAVVTPAALLQRYFRQRERMICDQVNVWVGAVVSLALAVSGVGAWSLVIGRLAGSVVAGIGLLACSPLPYRLGLDLQLVRPLLRFGLPLAGASGLVFAIGFVDQLAVGRVLGPVVLGYYVLAYNLASWPVTIFSQPLRSVAPAMFARLQHDRGAMSGAFHQVFRPVAAAAVPTCVVLAVAAPDVVELVYGPAWAPAAMPLRWLCLMAALRIFFELSYDYLVVLRRTRTILLIQVAWLIALVPAVLIGTSQAGAAGAAAAVAGIAGVVIVPLYLRALARTGIAMNDLRRSTASIAAVTAVLAGAVAVLGSILPGPFTALLTSGLLSVAVIGALLWQARGHLAGLRSPAAVTTP